MMTLLLALENKDTLSILQHKTVRTQLVNSKSILIQQKFTIEDLPASPRISFCFHIVLHLPPSKMSKFLSREVHLPKREVRLIIFWAIISPSSAL